MEQHALSFEVAAERPERVVRKARERARLLKRPTAGILFASGQLIPHLRETAERLAEEERREPLVDGPWLVAATLGVLTERGEHERQSAAAGIVLGGVRASEVVEESPAGRFDERLGSALREHPGATAFALLRSDRYEEDVLAALRTEGAGIGERVFGAGTVGEQDVLVVSGGRVQAGPGAALVISGPGPTHLMTSPGCRPLCEPAPITSTRGSMVLEIGGQPALEALSAAGANLPDEPLILLGVLGRPTDDGSPTPLMLRPIHGVDPGRGGILVGESLEEGTRVTFAIRDPHAARQALESGLRRLSQSTAGTAPRFGIYVNCAGRGTTLYGAPDVDVKLLRARFGDIPFVGLHSAFEIAPFDGATSIQLYAGVLGLFTAAS